MAKIQTDIKTSVANTKASMNLRMKPDVRHSINSICERNKIEYYTDSELLERIIKIALENSSEIKDNSSEIEALQKHLSIANSELLTANERLLESENEKDLIRNDLALNLQKFSRQNNCVPFRFHPANMQLVEGLASLQYNIPVSEVKDEHIQKMIFEQVFLSYQKYGEDLFGVISWGKSKVMRFYEMFKKQNNQ